MWILNLYTLKSGSTTRSGLLLDPRNNKKYKNKNLSFTKIVKNDGKKLATGNQNKSYSQTFPLSYGSITVIHCSVHSCEVPVSSIWILINHADPYSKGRLLRIMRIRIHISETNVKKFACLGSESTCGRGLCRWRWSCSLRGCDTRPAGSSSGAAAPPTAAGPAAARRPNIPSHHDKKDSGSSPCHSNNQHQQWIFIE